MSESTAENETPAEAESRDIVLRVSAGSNASATASALSHAIYEGKNVVLRAIGAGAVNQTVKALAIANSFVGSRGFSLSYRPGFDEVIMPDGTKVTAMVHKVIVN
ncbi:stage V sporulation protein S [Nonomuraea typhae]|uniref:Stage V sporulation protein S n=1 Tax=Nonomuraea typhae TaxID=2603600 RepID=A0ABW7YJD1_9ACTN